MRVACAECGKEISEDARVCPHCGYRGYGSGAGWVSSGAAERLWSRRREEIENMRRQALGENGAGGLARLANSTKSVATPSGSSAARNLTIGDSDDDI